jgi:hypothetical protein
MSLDDWLTATDPKILNCSDAWAAGSTNCAFAFNSWIGVEEAHAANVWVQGWDEGDDHIDSPDLDQDGHGLYVYISDGPYKIKDLTPATTVATPQADTQFANTGPLQDTFNWQYELEQGTSTSLTVTQTSSLVIDGSFSLGGFSFDVKASFDKSRTDNNTQTTVSRTTTTALMPVPANSNYAFTYTVYITTQEMLYGLDFSIAASSLANPPGGIAKATTPGQRGTWDKFWTMDALVPDGTTQTAQYKVLVTNIVTKIKAGPIANDGTVTWGPEKTVSPEDPSGSGNDSGGGNGNGNGGDDGGNDGGDDGGDDGGNNN